MPIRVTSVVAAVKKIFKSLPGREVWLQLLESLEGPFEESQRCANHGERHVYNGLLCAPGVARHFGHYAAHRGPAGWPRHAEEVWRSKMARADVNEERSTSEPKQATGHG